MKTTFRLAVALFAACAACNCAPMSSGYVNSQRGQGHMITTDAQLRQNRVQRANEYEEARHGNRMRNESYLGPLDTANQGVRGLRNLTNQFSNW